MKLLIEKSWRENFHTDPFRNVFFFPNFRDLLHPRTSSHSSRRKDIIPDDCIFIIPFSNNYCCYMPSYNAENIEAKTFFLALCAFFGLHKGITGGKKENFQFFSPYS